MDTTIQCLRKSESCDPIDHSKVHTLGYPSLMARYFFILTKEESRCSHMDIFSLIKRIEESRILREKSKDTNLYLRIVCDEKEIFC